MRGPLFPHDVGEEEPLLFRSKYTTVLSHLPSNHKPVAQAPNGLNILWF